MGGWCSRKANPSGTRHIIAFILYLHRNEKRRALSKVVYIIVYTLMGANDLGL